MDTELEVSNNDSADDEVQAMLDRFAQALTTGDISTLVQLWGVPSLVLHEGVARPVSTVDEVKQFFGHAPKQYEKQGVFGTRAEIVRLIWLTDQMASVQVRWPYLDIEGQEMGEERSTYLVMKGNEGHWKIWVAAMQGVTPQH